MAAPAQKHPCTVAGKPHPGAGACMHAHTATRARQRVATRRMRIDHRSPRVLHQRRRICVMVCVEQVHAPRHTATRSQLRVHRFGAHQLRLGLRAGHRPLPSLSRWRPIQHGFLMSLRYLMLSMTRGMFDGRPATPGARVVCVQTMNARATPGGFWGLRAVPNWQPCKRG